MANDPAVTEPAVTEPAVTEPAVTEPLAFRCGAAARLREDALLGTASPAKSWLLIENPGPWARRALEDVKPDPGAGREIAARARSIGARPLLIRRYGRRKGSAPQFGFIDSTTNQGSWREFESLAQVATAPWVGEDPVPEPIYLSCTHGRHDQCCAIAGRPVAAQFAKLRPATSWECSHLGGDRFAGNVVVLPYGLYYGFVDPLDVTAIITATEHGQVHLPLLRGYATNSPPEQAARITAQQELDLTGVTDLPVARSAAIARGRWEVVLRRPDGSDLTVTVEERRGPDARATCAHTEPVAMREFNATLA